MSLIEINWKPDKRQLRQFGFICVVALPLIAWFWGAGTTTLICFAAAGLVLALIGQFLPAFLSPVFVGLCVIAAPIGLVVGELCMLFVYFVVFLPIGILFRVTRRDALKLKIERDAPSYWQPKQQPASAASYYRQS